MHDPASLFPTAIQYGALGLLGLVVVAMCVGGLLVARAVVAGVDRAAGALERGEERQTDALDRIAESTARLEVLASAGACRYPGRGGGGAFPTREAPTRPDRVRPILPEHAEGSGAMRSQLPSSPI